MGVDVGVGAGASVNVGVGLGVGVNVWQCCRGVGKTRFETRARIHKQRTRTSSNQRNH